MDRPVIIIGGGIWGSLLAYRLKSVLPEVQFKLYEESPTLGNQTCSFRQSDCEGAMSWLEPFISKTWPKHLIKVSKSAREVSDSYHLIGPEKLHDAVSAKIGENLVLNGSMTPELALKEAAFVIDARNVCHYRVQGHRKFFSLEIELEEAHGLEAPVVFDGNFQSRGLPRHLEYFPLTEKTVLIRDFWFSEDRSVNVGEMRNSLLEVVRHLGWRIQSIFNEESGTTTLPLSEPLIRRVGRVISLAGLFHDTKGCSMALATELIDRMVRTSFRFGELEAVVAEFRKEHEADRVFFRHLNHLMIKKRRTGILHTVHSQPLAMIERYSRGQLHVMDRYKILMGNSRYELMQSMKGTRAYPLASHLTRV